MSLTVPELDARVPLIAADPRAVNSHGKDTKAIVELVDVYPTLASLCSLKDGLPNNLEGDDFSRVLSDTTASVKEAAFTQHQQPFYGAKSNWKAWGYSVRTADWRYTQWRAIKDKRLIAEELYNHQQDSGETQNVAGQNSDVVAELAKLIEAQFLR